MPAANQSFKVKFAQGGALDFHLKLVIHIIPKVSITYPPVERVGAIVQYTPLDDAWGKYPTDIGSDCAIHCLMMRPSHLVRNRCAEIFLLRLFICTVTLITLPALAGNSAPLVWNPSAGSNVAGYKIYYGVASHVYTNSVDVGNVTSATITGLSGSTTYHFAATSYYANGVESGFSNEAILTLSPPTAPVSTSTSYVNGQFAFDVSGVTNYQCVVQTSSNLLNWVSVQTNTSPFTFVVPNANQFSKRFYRTYYLP